MIIALNASPFETGKTDQRMLHAVARAVEAELPVVYVNMIGGQDELVYDGGSFAISRGQAGLPPTELFRSRQSCRGDRPVGLSARDRSGYAT